MRYSFIAFDIDGTLIDSGPADMKALQDVLLEETGRLYPLEELVFAEGIPGEDAVRRLPVKDPAAFLRRWIHRVHAYAHTVTVFPGIVDTLTALRKAGVGLGIVTSRVRQEYESGFLPLGLGDFFSTVVLADHTAEHKPKPAPLLRLMELAGTPAGELLYLGDSPYDSACAHAAGVDFALALWGCQDPAVPAQHRLNAPAELLDLAIGS